MIALSYDKADGFVQKLKKKGVDVRWDGWKMVFFREDKRALRNPQGRQYKGRWGFETVVDVNEAGKWLVDYRLTRPKTVGA